MILKTALVVIIISVFLSSRGFSQQITIFGKAPIRIDVQGLLLTTMRTGKIFDPIAPCPSEKLIPIYFAGNWIGIQTANEPVDGSHIITEHNRSDTLLLNHFAAHQLYAKSYYTQTPITSTSIPSENFFKHWKNKHLLKDGDDIVYASLKVKDYLFVDFLDYHTDTLVRRYYIKRLKLIPVIKIAQYPPVSDSGNKLKINLRQLGRDNRMLLQPDLLTTFTPDNALPDKKLEIQYTLINLKSRDTIKHVDFLPFSLHRLTANTEYLLQVSYILQPESSKTYDLFVQPYWYQAATIRIIFCGVICLLAALIIFMLVNRKIRQTKQNQLQAEQNLRAIQTQLNPHFTFNALSSIQGLINTQRIDEANRYLEEFSSLLRKTLTKSQKPLNTLDEELTILKKYLSLEQLRFNFEWNIEIDSQIQAPEVEIPTMLLQPLIENAVKHGIPNLGSKGVISILISCDPNAADLIISIKDNGKGITLPAQTGHGLKLTMERIGAMNSMRRKQTIEINFENNPGAHVKLIFHNCIND